MALPFHRTIDVRPLAEQREAALRSPERLRATAWTRSTVTDATPDLERIVRLLAATTAVPMAGFSLVEADGQHLAARFGIESADSSVDAGVLSRACVAQDEALVVPDTKQDRRFRDSAPVAGAPHVRFYAGVPVHSPDREAVGTLFVADTVPRELSHHELLILEDLRESIEEILRLTTLAGTDPLTGLANRGALEAMLVRELRLRTHEPRPLVVAMVDVDDFRGFNERYGHAAGDTALRDVADALRRAWTRPDDLVARFGGEEFAGMLPGVPEAAVDAVARRAMDEVHALAVPHEGTRAGILTVSVGLLHLPSGTPTSSVGDVLAAAEEALQDAKAAGRDAVSVSWRRLVVPYPRG